MTDVTITKEKTDARHGRYVARIAGIDAEAELTFTCRTPDRISADHTGAPEALRGLFQADPQALLLITGGDAARLLPHLGSRWRREPLLVLEGLRRLAEPT